MSRGKAPGKAQVKPNSKPPPGPIGNTNGMIVPDTAPNPGLNSAPAIKPTPKEKGWWDSWKDTVHTGLDIAGAIPVVGIFADGANAAIYTAEGDYVNAAISGVSAAANLIPGGGAVMKGGKLAVKGAQAVFRAEARQVVKQTTKEIAEAAAKKKLAREAEEAAAKKLAKEAKEAAAAAKKAKQKKGGNDRKKKKLKCGQYGKYGDLKKQSGDNKFDRDHIPSKAALKERAKSLLPPGKKLTESQAKAIDKAGEAIAIPKQAHIDVSPTYGQTVKDAAKDASDLAGSARRDVEAMLKEIDKYDEDGKCKKAYQKAAAKIMRMSKQDFDKILKDILKNVK